MVWEVLTYFPTCAIASLGDRVLLHDDSWRSSPMPFVLADSAGVGTVYGLAESDGVPVEIAQRDGRVVGVRIEFTDDVDRLESAGEGRWVELGQIRIGPGGAVAAALEADDTSLVEVPLLEGRYRAETFATSSDDLGIRLLIV